MRLINHNNTTITKTLAENNIADCIEDMGFVNYSNEVMRIANTLLIDYDEAIDFVVIAWTLLYKN